MQIIVDTFDSFPSNGRMIKTAVIEITNQDTVMSLKDKIAQRTGFSNTRMQQYNVRFNGKILNETNDVDKPLVSYGIVRDDTLSLLPRMNNRQLQIVGGYFVDL